MFAADEYLLLDFGAGRKLERFGQVTVDRPAPAAESAIPQFPDLWPQATARFERTSGDTGEWPMIADAWIVRHGSLVFELMGSPTGQLGLFPEQAENWDWLTERIASAARTLKVLNLFAYTGGSTLAAAAAGAEVVHVDAATTAIARARRNAELSGLATAPIRWIPEDVRLFVERELRRGNRYDAVVLDPPSYGHGPKGQPWKIESDLPELLHRLAQLTAPRPEFILLTCHSAGLGPTELKTMLEQTFHGPANARPLELITPGDRRLPSGTVATWTDGA
jgi:23S rRNA (cytosine1962-C5)-methyltransferase